MKIRMWWCQAIMSISKAEGGRRVRIILFSFDPPRQKQFNKDSNRKIKNTPALISGSVIPIKVTER